ncbi:MAG: hypothetical protein AAF184_18715 [Pseudomonadota bacterium]
MARSERLAAGSASPSALPGTLRPTRPPRMTRAAADVAAVAWASFLAACAASLIAFAIFDPGRLAEASEVIDHIDRMAGYGLGFLFFWVIGLVAGGLSVLLIRSSRREARQQATTGALD